MGKITATLQKASPAIRTVEFGLAFGCILGAWFSTDMTLISVALVVGWIFAVVGILSAPNQTLRTSALLSVVVAIIFTAIGGFLFWHSRAALDECNGDLKPMSDTQVVACVTSFTTRVRTWADGAARAEFDAVQKSHQSLVDIDQQQARTFNERFRPDMNRYFDEVGSRTGGGRPDYKDPKYSGPEVQGLVALHEGVDWPVTAGEAGALADLLDAQVRNLHYSADAK